MPGSADAELYFIVGMMVLILIICGVAVYVFFRQYRKEMREKQRKSTLSQQVNDASSEVAEAAEEESDA
ncbi:hypothetical protein [Leptolyngbya sp. 7M]|uniref:hypothetical protein n=1 Tax=Leptolyngbya sp. 7M TaxID=2812896 RepID=UPI001B8B817B|nr:hypothetical protein [Leptolyngbya sp. 7M]QYO65346.1 hypothetical protein JVX88_00760 [Leptolyngbya sp. 7M]